MGNPFKFVFRGVGKAVGGVTNVVGGIFGHPIDFLTGKNCSTLCGPTWDVSCYIENFCIHHLFRFLSASFLLYLVLLLTYMLYKLKVFHVVFKGSFKMFWAAVSNVFMCWEHGCLLVCGCLSRVHERRKQHKLDIEMANANASNTSSSEESDDLDSSFSYRDERYRRRRKSWAGENKRNLMRRSLKAQNHRVHVSVDSDYGSKRKHIKHDDVRVIRTSSFAKKGPSQRSKRRYK